MKLKSVFALAAAIIAAGITRADPFEGKVSMTVTADNGQAQNISYEVKGPVMRVNVQGRGGQGAAVIMDLGKKQMTILMPQQHMYMVRPFGASAGGAPNGNPYGQPAPSSSSGPAQVQPTTEKATLLGYPCTKYTVTENGGTTSMWVTDALGSFFGFGGMTGRQRGGMPAAGAPASWEQALAGKGFFPLKVSGTDAKGHSFNLVVTAVSKQTFDEAEFLPPSDYREFNLGNMMGGFGH